MRTDLRVLRFERDTSSESDSSVVPALCVKGMQPAVQLAEEEHASLLLQVGFDLMERCLNRNDTMGRCVEASRSSRTDVLYKGQHGLRLVHEIDWEQDDPCSDWDMINTDSDDDFAAEQKVALPPNSLDFHGLHKVPVCSTGNLASACSTLGNSWELSVLPDRAWS
jgi:hypothetical protein